EAFPRKRGRADAPQRTVGQGRRSVVLPGRCRSGEGRRGPTPAVSRHGTVAGLSPVFAGAPAIPAGHAPTERTLAAGRGRRGIAEPVGRAVGGPCIGHT